MRRMLITTWLLALVVVSGCSQPKPLPVAPVSGKLLICGRPATDAEVTLHAPTPLKDEAGRTLFPTARVGADGSFRVTTYAPDDGAPIGEYKVTVTWSQLTTDAGETTIGPDQLAGRFAQPSTPAASVQVREGTNELPVIDLR
jgi:hypothetical protein